MRLPNIKTDDKGNVALCQLIYSLEKPKKKLRGKRVRKNR